MLGTTQLNSNIFSDHIAFNKGYMKRRECQMRITTIKENKFDTFDNPCLPSYVTTVTLKFKLR